MFCSAFWIGLPLILIGSGLSAGGLVFIYVRLTTHAIENTTPLLQGNSAGASIGAAIGLLVVGAVVKTVGWVLAIWARITVSREMRYAAAAQRTLYVTAPPLQSQHNNPNYDYNPDARVPDSKFA